MLRYATTSVWTCDHVTPSVRTWYSSAMSPDDSLERFAYSPVGGDATISPIGGGNSHYGASEVSCCSILPHVYGCLGDVTPSSWNFGPFCGSSISPVGGGFSISPVGGDTQGRYSLERFYHVGENESGHNCFNGSVNDQGLGDSNPWYWSYIEDRYMMIDKFSSTCKHDLYLYPLIFPDAYDLYPIHEDGSNNVSNVVIDSSDDYIRSEQLLG